ncbi:ABC transporter permease [Acidobacteriota bacterium]
MKPHLFKLFLTEFRKRKKKTALITFAIAWGSLSLLLLMSFGRGLSNTFKTSFSGLGQDLIMVVPGQTSKDYKGLPKGRRIQLYPGDVELLRSRIPEIGIISPESYTNMTVTYKGKEANRSIHGVYPEFSILRSQVAQMGGRYIDPEDERLSKKVAFLGWNVAAELFGDRDPIGKELFINRVPFKVIGVMKKKLQSSSYNIPDFDVIYIPFATFSQMYSQRFLDFLQIQPAKKKYSLLIEKRLKEILGKKYRFAANDEYALGIFNTIQMAEEAGKVFLGIEAFLGLIGALTLLIAAVGVANLMYAIVKERTKEIGIKMALGAKRRHITIQFLLEALFIFLKGTFWGTLIAFNIVGLVRLIPVGYDFSEMYTYLLRPEFSLDILLIFISVMGILVFLSGIFPALKASKLNPVEALRYE